jgi:hypothetical protein
MSMTFSNFKLDDIYFKSIFNDLTIWNIFLNPFTSNKKITTFVIFFPFENIYFK